MDPLQAAMIANLALSNGRHRQDAPRTAEKPLGSVSLLARVRRLKQILRRRHSHHEARQGLRGPTGAHPCQSGRNKRNLEGVS